MTRSTNNREQQQSEETPCSQSNGYETNPTGGEQASEGGHAAPMTHALDEAEAGDSILSSECPEPTKVMVVSRISTAPQKMGFNQHGGDTPLSRSSLAPLRSESAEPPPGSPGACRLGRSRASSSLCDDTVGQSPAPTPPVQPGQSGAQSRPFSASSRLEANERRPVRDAHSVPGPRSKHSCAVVDGPGANGAPPGHEDESRDPTFELPRVVSSPPSGWLMGSLRANGGPIYGSNGRPAGSSGLLGIYSGTSGSGNEHRGAPSRPSSGNSNGPPGVPGTPSVVAGALPTTSSGRSESRSEAGNDSIAGAPTSSGSTRSAETQSWPVHGAEAPAKGPTAGSSGFTLSSDGLRE